MIIKLLLAAMFAASGPAVAAEPVRGVVVSTAAAAVSAANRRFFARCSRGQFGVDEMLSDAALRKDMDTFAADEARELLDYVSCRALQGNPAGCAWLEIPGDANKGSFKRCRAFVAEDRFLFNTLRGGDALSACRGLLELAGKRGPNVDKDCAALVKAVRDGGSKLTCESFQQTKFSVFEESCEDLLVTWSGDPKACDRYTEADVRRECRARAALVAGLRDPAQCASSPSCQVLAAKAPGACDGLSGQFSRMLCARVAKDIAAEQKGLTKEQQASRQAELRNKAKAEATAAAVAAAKAKAAEVEAQTKARLDADKEKSLRDIEARAAKAAVKAAATEAAIKAKAEAAAKKEAETAAKIAEKPAPQYRKGEPMQKESAESKAFLKAISEGRPIAPPKPKKKNADAPETSEP